jgi:aldehyde dehydrogenase (NAD+)
MTANELYSRQRNAWLEHPYPDAEYRLRAIRRIRDWVRAHRSDIRAALTADLGKPEAETDLTEILVVLMEAKYALRRLRRWMKPRRAGTPLALFGSRSRVSVEPKGVVLIISPWNFPFNLALMPLISALAAGNRCVIKPSELSPATSRLVASMVAELFSPEEVAVLEGDAEAAKALLAEPFDHIFFTGSDRVGRKVMEAAARNLSSVTLELGGKTPAVVDRSAHLATAAERIVWAKYVNAGQTCIAPDYVLVPEDLEEGFVREATAALERLYPDATPQRHPGAYARIVTRRHADRLRALIDEAVSAGATPVAPLDEDGAGEGGDAAEGDTADDHFVPPVILRGAGSGMSVMREEIFGPVLPVITVSGRREAFAFVRERPRPLALYMFAADRRAAREACTDTSAGGVCLNDGLLHYLNPALPFGGVGNSGTGKAHGKSGFLEFSNRKPVLSQRRGFTTSRLVYPPYTKAVRRRIDWMLKLLG